MRIKVDFRQIFKKAMNARGMTNYQLAKLAGIDRSQLTRFFKLDNEDLRGLSGFQIQNIFNILRLEIKI